MSIDHFFVIVCLPAFQHDSYKHTPTHHYLSFQKYANGLRFTMMVLGGLLSVIGSRAIGFTSAGALGCMVLSCVCGRSWQKPKHQKNVRCCNPNRKYSFWSPVCVHRDLLITKRDTTCECVFWCKRPPLELHSHQFICLPIYYVCVLNLWLNHHTSNKTPFRFIWI